jgi:hypothetical protein
MDGRQGAFPKRCAKVRSFDIIFPDYGERGIRFTGVARLNQAAASLATKVRETLGHPVGVCVS